MVSFAGTYSLRQSGAIYEVNSRAHKLSIRFIQSSDLNEAYVHSFLAGGKTWIAVIMKDPGAEAPNEP